MQQSELIDRLQHFSQQLMVEAKKIQQLPEAKPIVNDPEIKRGYWGNKFINWIDPQIDSMQKMNTFASTNPLGKPIPV